MHRCARELHRRHHHRLRTRRPGWTTTFLMAAASSTAALDGRHPGAAAMSPVRRPSKPSVAAEGPAPPPGVSGRLYTYRRSPGSLQAFESPADHAFTRYAVYVGGLTDGLNACPYVEDLAAACEAKGWALVQPVLSSSYAGYGTGSLARDVEELDELVQFLAARRGAAACALIGHSTGCQQSVYFMKHASPESRRLVRAVVLQAPCSDREAATMEPGGESQALLAKSEGMIAEGRGGEIVANQYGFVPITADRYASLVGRGGADDMFSSDFSDNEIVQRLGHMSTSGQATLPGSIPAAGEQPHPGLSTLVAFSMADEYVPASVDKSRLVDRIVWAMGYHVADPASQERRSFGFFSRNRRPSETPKIEIQGLKLEGASHNLAKPEGGQAMSRFVRETAALLSRAAA